MKIIGVAKNSVGQELGIKAGDELVAFNSLEVSDILDYEYFDSQENFSISVKTENGVEEIDVEKYEDETLGLEFDDEIKVRPCKNKCIFCFVDQLPKFKDLRKTLKVKDDDYRHSFISGTYITLTNLSSGDIERIKRLKLSPLYVSVHSTSDEIRNNLLGIKSGLKVLPLLKEFHSAGIELHCQIVYCPGFNEDLEQSINDLMPLSKSLSIVPVGLTKNCNPLLKPVDAAAAEKVIGIVKKAQDKALKTKGSRFVWAADELYIKAGEKIEGGAYYEDYPQIENGVGLLAKFNEDFTYALTQIKSGKTGNISIATGESAFSFIKEKAGILTKKFGGNIEVYKIKNNFFGETVTVAGLITGSDLLFSLKDKPLGEKLILPSVMLKEFETVFLDNITVRDLEEKLQIKIEIINADGESFVRSIVK